MSTAACPARLPARLIVAAAAPSAAAGEGGATREEVIARRVDEPRLRPGTWLVRSWQGRTYSVLVTERSFVTDGHEYPSLSRIAEAVNGLCVAGIPWRSGELMTTRRRGRPTSPSARPKVSARKPLATTL